MLVTEKTPTTEQLQAIRSWGRGNVCVVAGPGSGKTLVLVERFKWLVTDKHIPIRDILAITFTEKAAASMRQKLVGAFPPASLQRQEIERAYVSTVHGFWARLLRENAIDAAVDPEFRVLDEWEAGFELRRAIEEALDSGHAAQPDRARLLLSSFGSDQVAESLIELHRAIRAAGSSLAEAVAVRPEFNFDSLWTALLQAFELAAACSTEGWSAKQRDALGEALAIGRRLCEVSGKPSGEHFEMLTAVKFRLDHFKTGSRQRSLLKQIRETLVPACRAALLLEQNKPSRKWLLDVLQKADARYREEKRRAGTLDFADLEERAVRLLQSASGPSVCHFSDVLMDEFQDTNPLQARLVESLSQDGRFFAVGDINQSIYGFRHADPDVFRSYRQRTEREGGHVEMLSENFRSRQPVLDAVRAITTNVEGIEPRNLTAKRVFPPAVAPSLAVLTVHGGDADAAMRLEARHVAARIQELCGSLPLAAGTADYASFAVLLRTADQVRVFERELREKGVPCQVTAGQGFYEAQEVQDLVQFLHVLWNPLDEISLAAVLRSPMVGISDETLFRLKLVSGSLVDGLGRISGAPPDELERIDRFRRLFENYRRRRDYLPVDRLLSLILSETGYEAWLLDPARNVSGAAPARAAANVRKLIALARHFAKSGPGGLQAFLERVEDLRRDQFREAEAEPPEQSSDAVQLMTIHSSKGLEFPVVFLPALNRRPPYDTDPVSFAPEIGIGRRWRDPAAGEPHSDSIAKAIKGDRETRRREENQRLFYVAMTRAEELLILSASFGPQAKAEHWANNLADNLGIDLERVDNQVRFTELRGVPARVLQTDQEPSPVAASRPQVPAAGSAEVRRFDRAPVDDQSDAAVSASSVTLFDLCPRKYYLSRYLGFERSGSASVAQGEDEDGQPTAHDETDASEFGRRVHALLAGTATPAEASPEARRLAANFESSALGRRVAAADRVEREQGFLVLVGDPDKSRLLRGQIDLWFEEGGEIVVVDYKTDEVKPAETAERAVQYALQLRSYALVVERIAGRRPSRAIVYFLRPNVPVEISLGNASLEAVRAKIEELFEAQSRLSFPLREGKHCFQCPHWRHACPAEFPARERAAQTGAAE